MYSKRENIRVVFHWCTTQKFTLNATSDPISHNLKTDIVYRWSRHVEGCNLIQVKFVLKLEDAMDFQSRLRLHSLINNNKRC